VGATGQEERIRRLLDQLEAVPGDGAALDELAGIFEAQGRYDELVALRERAAGASTEPAASTAQLAAAARAARDLLKDGARAEQLWRQLLIVDPAHGEAHGALLRIAEERDEPALLAATLDGAAAAAPDARSAAQLTFRLGRLYEERLGRRDRAALLYLRAVRLDPALHAARDAALACFLALRRWAQARRLLDAARGEGPPAALAAAYARLGAALAEEPLEHPLAMDVLIEALTLDRAAPGAVEARERLRALPRTWREEGARLEARAAELARAMDRREAATLLLRVAQLHAAWDPAGLPRVVELIERAWSLSPGAPEALELLDRVFSERNDFPGQAESLGRLIEGTRERAALVALQLELARLSLVRFGDAVAARDALLRALELDPACETAAVQAFEHLVDAGDAAEAMALLERHLAAAPEKAQHALLRTRAAGLALELLGDPARARRHLEAALRADPGHAPAALALAPILEQAGEWQRLVEILEVGLLAEKEPAARVGRLERMATIQAERLERPREALRTLARALALDPRRPEIREAMERAAAAAGAETELLAAYRAAAGSLVGDAEARAPLLRRMAELQDGDLDHADEAARAWREVAANDPSDSDAAEALVRAMARAGHHADAVKAIEGELARAAGPQKRELTMRLARLRADGGEPEKGAALWRGMLGARPDDPEALRGLADALGRLPGERAAEERVAAIGRLAVRADAPGAREQLELERAEVLLHPLGRLGEAAGSALTVLRSGGTQRAIRDRAVALLETLLARGVDPLRIAQVLAPAYAAAGQPEKQVAMLELMARRLPSDADPRERARHLLDASVLRADRLGDPRGALSDASEALHACPDHAEARRRCEQLATEVGAFGELYGLLVETARRLEGRVDEELALRRRAAEIAEQDLGSVDDADAQLRRCLALRPEDSELMADLTRVAAAGERWEEVAELLRQRSRRAAGAERLALLTKLGELLLERLHSPAAAADVYAEALDAAADDQRPRLLARRSAALEQAGMADERDRVLGELAAGGHAPFARLGGAEAAILSGKNGTMDLDSSHEAGGSQMTDSYSSPGTPSEAASPPTPFDVAAAAARANPGEPSLRRELRRIADETEEAEGCARVLEELALVAPAEARAAIWRELADWSERRLASPDRAAQAWARVLAVAPGDVEALTNLRRHYRARERWQDLFDVCAEIARRSTEPVARHDALREAAVTAQGKLQDPQRAVAAWRAVLATAPADREAMGALAELLREDPAARATILARQAQLNEGEADPRKAIESYAAILAERPRDAATIVGLERLLQRADARAAAARLLENVHRVAGDARRLADVLEVRLEVAARAERTPLLAEVAALHERIGDRQKAFLARVQLWRETIRDGQDQPAARAELERIATDAGATQELVGAYEEAIEGGMVVGQAALDVRRRLATLWSDRLGKPEQAARWLEEIAAQAPGAEVLGALARIYRKLGDLPQLTSSLRRLAQSTAAPGARKELWLEVARITEEQIRDADGAIEAYRQVLQADPDDLPVMRLLGRLLGVAERFEEQAALLVREIALVEKRPGFEAEGSELRFRLGRLLQDRLADAAGAVAAYREVLARVARHPGALKALEELSRTAGPSAREAATILEATWASGGDHAKVVDALEAKASLEADAGVRAGHLRRVAELYAGPLRNPEMAFLAAGRALNASPGDPELIDLVVRLAEAGGLTDELLAILAENADRAHEPSVRAEYQRRIARASRAEPQRAAEGWQRVLDLLPDDREAMVGLADSLRGGGESDRLAQAIGRNLAVERDGAKRARLFAELARLQEQQLGDAPGALLTWKRYLELIPDDREALASLHALCVTLERWVDLDETLLRQIALARKSKQGAEALALTHELGLLKEERLLDRDGAVACYEEVLQADPAREETIERLEAILLADPGNARAAMALEKAFGASGDQARRAATLEQRANERPDPQERKALYLELADLREKKLGDREMAFLAVCKAFRQDPSDAVVRERMERLAASSEHYEELAGIYEDELERLAPADLATVALRLGQLYEEKLAEPDRAAGFFRRALALDPEAARVALPALDRVYQRLEAWTDLADVLQSRADQSSDAERVGFLNRLGQVAQEKLGAFDRAAAAWEGAVATDPRHLPSLRALEPLYEAAERKDDLLRVLDAQKGAGLDGAERERVLVKLGGLAIELLKLDEAVGHWKALLAVRPRHEQALVALEELYERLERWQELADHLKLRLQSTVDRKEISRLNDKLGRVMGTRLGDATHAIQSFKAVLDSDPRNRQALEALRDIYQANGDQEGLAGIYRRLVPIQDDAVGVKRVRLDLARVLVKAGQKTEAAEQAKRAFDIEPHTVEDLETLEEVFRGAGAIAEGVRAAEARATLLGQRSPGEAIPAWLSVADLWRGQKRNDLAALALEKVLELEPAHRVAFDQLRELHAQGGNWRAWARVSDVFAPNIPDPEEKLGVLKEIARVHEQRLGQKEMAFISWSRALADAPGDDEALAQTERLAADTTAWDELAGVLEQVAESARGMVRAKLLLRLGRAQDEKLDDAAGAEGSYRRALEADPASPEALEALTGLFKKRGRVRELVITLEQRFEAAASLEEKKATLLEAAKLYDGELHDADEAVTALKRLLDLEPDDKAAVGLISQILRRDKRWPELLSIFGRARDLAPDEAGRADWQLQMAVLQENELGDDEGAIDSYRSVLGADGANVAALGGLERLYTKIDRFDELNRVYERQISLASDPREKVRVLGKSAGIFEEKLDDPRRAIERNEEVLGIDGGNLPAIKALERLYRQERLWEKFISVSQHHLGLVNDRREQVALEVAIGEVWYKELQRVDRAESIFNHALQADPESREAVSALAKLYERSGNWNLALDMLKREARVAGASPDAVDIHVRMGAIQENMLLDTSAAKEAYGRALQIDPGCLAAIRAMKGIFERERNQGGFLEQLVSEAHYAEEPAEQTRLLTEVGRVHQDERNDPEGAARYFEEALKRTPGHLEAARPLSDIYVAAQQWDQAERVLDGMVAALESSGDARELCRQSYRQGYVAEKLGKREKALASYRRAFDLDATYLPALEGLGHLLVAEGQFEEAMRVFTAILIHHREGLTDLEVVETNWQIGELAAKMGQGERAINTFKKALEIDTNHEPSRRSLARLLQEAGDWEGAVEQLQRLLPLLDGPAKFETLVVIGEACRDKLKDPYQAIDALLAAARIDPSKLGVAEALLGLYRETRQGRKAADVLGQVLARPEVQGDAVRAAKLQLALAETLRDEVKDEEAAVAAFERALDLNPRLVAAFSAIEEILSRQKRWNDLEQSYVRMVQRIPKTPDAAQARLGLWKALGDLYKNVLRNDDGARLAYQVVVKADPNDVAAAELYAELAAKVPGQEQEAIAAYRQIVRSSQRPARAVSALVALLAARKEFDRAFSAAQVVTYLLGGATAEEQQVVARLRKLARDQAGRALDDASWPALLHERLKGPLADIMTVLALHARPMFVQSLKDLGLNPKKDEVEVEGSLLFFVNIFKYVTRTLGLRTVRLFRKDDVPSRLQLVSTEPLGLVVADQMFEERPKKELAFLLAKALAFGRPELFMARLMPHDQLDLVFQAACSVGTSKFVVTADPHMVEKLKRTLEKTLPQNVLKNTLKLLARKYCEVQHAGDVRSFMDAAELTANRVGALLSGDLEVVRKMVTAEKAQVSKLRDETQLRDLALFCLSDEYAALRERLGLSVVVPG
jgi:tetratricopeptide (TPR) repeat protein